MHDYQYQSGLPVREVVAGLVSALQRADDASAHAVVWFDEVLRRRLHREVGYLSPAAFARDELGLSASRAKHLFRLARLVREYPRLRRAVLDGRLGWTNARTIASVLTPESEATWVGLAIALGRRALEHRVREARRVTQDRARVAAGDGE